MIQEIYNLRATLTTLQEQMQEQANINLAQRQAAQEQHQSFQNAMQQKNKELDDQQQLFAAEEESREFDYDLKMKKRQAEYDDFMNRCAEDVKQREQMILDNHQQSQAAAQQTINQLSEQLNSSLIKQQTMQ